MGSQLISHACSIAVSLAPEDPEIAFNLAAVLEACKYQTSGQSLFLTQLPIGGHLDEALAQYKRSKEYGVERAAMRSLTLPLAYSSLQLWIA